MFQLASESGQRERAVFEMATESVPSRRTSVAELNARPPYVDSLTREVHIIQPTAGHGHHRPTMLETGLQSSTRYPGAMLCCHLYTWTHSLNRIRSVTSSQCRTWLWKRVSPWSYLPWLNTTRAAASRTPYRCTVAATQTEPGQFVNLTQQPLSFRTSTCQMSKGQEILVDKRSF